MTASAPGSHFTTPTFSAHGLGALLTTEVDRIALGTHHGRALHARVERRSARFSAGRRWHVSLTIGRTRPIAIEVTEVSEVTDAGDGGDMSAPGQRYDFAIATTDPWLRAARRIGALALAAAAILVVARRLQARTSAEGGHRGN